MSAIDSRITSNELTAIISRLEAATSRLEDIASSTIPPPPSDAPDAPKSNGVNPPTQQAIATLPSPPPPTIVQAPAINEVVKEPIPESVAEFDNFIQGAVKRYVNLSDEIGGVVAEQVSILYITLPLLLPTVCLRSSGPRRVSEASFN